MVVTVVGCSGGASGGGFGEHGGGCPLAADELGDATLDTCRAVQPAAPATRTAAIAARRAGRNCQADIGITVLRRTFALRSLVQPPRSRRQRQMTASVRTIGLALAVATGTIGSDEAACPVVLVCRQALCDRRPRYGWDGAGAPGGAAKARARRGERRTRRRAAAPGDLTTAQLGNGPLHPRQRITRGTRVRRSAATCINSTANYVRNADYTGISRPPVL